MATTSVVSARPSFSLKLLAGGLIAGMAMAAWQMMAETILPGGNGFWSPPTYIAATVLRDLQTIAAPASFDLVTLLVGLMGHMMNAIIFGLVFSFFLAPRFRSLAGQTVAGAVYGVALYLLMWIVIDPLIDPVILRLNGLSFLVAHLLYGIALGAVNYRITQAG